jgi:hypothetical protein
MDGTFVKHIGFIEDQTGVPISMPADWTIGAAGDYDGDGCCDIIWRDAGTGENLLWRLDGTTVIGTQALEAKAGANWRIVGPR